MAGWVAVGIAQNGSELCEIKRLSYRSAATTAHICICLYQCKCTSNVANWARCILFVHGFMSVWKKVLLEKSIFIKIINKKINKRWFNDAFGRFPFHVKYNVVINEFADYYCLIRIFIIIIFNYSGFKL